LLDPTKAEGKIILDKIAARQFIKKREQRNYNKQITDAAPQLDRKPG
jgi:hypothetical protein